MDQFKRGIAKVHSKDKQSYQVSKEHSSDFLWCAEKFSDNWYAYLNLMIIWSFDLFSSLFWGIKYFVYNVEKTIIAS